jgi:arylsulfatase
MNEKALDFVRRRRNDPFFLYVSWTMPHFEPHVPEDSIAEYRGKIPNGAPWADRREGRLKPQNELGPAYAGMVTRVDRYLGRVMSLLKELDLDGDTLVFFTSDNGGMMQNFEKDFFRNTGIYRGQKGNLYEGGIRVPMVARWPGRIKAGQVSNFAWCFQDLLPTAAEAAGVGAPRDVDGISVMPTLLGRQQKPHDYLCWEQPRYNAATGTFRDEAPEQAMRRGDWKAVRPKPGGPAELYNLAADPSESKDLAPSRRELVAEFEKRMEKARTVPRQQKEPPHPWWDARS